MINNWLAERVLKALDGIESGRLLLTLPDGRTYHFAGDRSGPDAAIHVHDWSLFPALAISGEIGLLDSYRLGHWSTPDLTSLLCLGVDNAGRLQQVLAGSSLSRLFNRLRYLVRNNSEQGSRRNIHAHYDIGNSFYRLWLDDGMTYSSALFTDEAQELNKAQDNKYQRILDRLETEGGRLLEIGCGWGGFAEKALNQGDFQLRGITLSEQQWQYAKNRLGSSADIVLEDYRRQQGKYDRIVSIEMFEAVGENHWQTYFSRLASLLKPDGKAVIQTITVRDEAFAAYRKSADVIRTYIFPGGMLPSPAKFSEAAARTGLRVNDSFHFGQDYGRTLEYWLANFEARLEQVRQLGFDEAFIRVWRFYLASCIATFRSGATSVMQTELSHA